MLLNESETLLVSALEGEPAGSISIRDLQKGTVHYALSPVAGRVSVFSGLPGHFAVTRYREAGHLEITAHTFSKPAEVLSALHVSLGMERFEGPTDPWKYLPRAYIYQGPGKYQAPQNKIILISLSRREAVLRPFPPEGMSANVQPTEAHGVVDSFNGPLLISGGGGDVHLIDPVTWKLVGTLDSSTAGMSPKTAAFRRTSKEFWVADSTRLVCYRKRLLGGWAAVHEIKARHSENSDTSFNPSRIVFSADEAHCAVLRPERGDAVIVDCKTYQVLNRTPLAAGVSIAALLNSGQLVDASQFPS